MPRDDGENPRNRPAVLHHHLVHAECGAGNGKGLGPGKNAHWRLAFETGDQALDGDVGRRFGVDGAEIANGATQALAALDQHGALAGGGCGSGGAESRHAAADDGEIHLDGLVDGGVVPGRAAHLIVAIAMVEGARRAEQPVAQRAEQPTRGDGVATAADGHQVEAGQGRRAVHRERRAFTGAHQRGEAFIERQRLVAVAAGGLDAVGESCRQNGIAGKAVDRPPVEPELQRLPPVEFGAAEAVRGVGGKTAGKNRHAGTI